jgi:ATP-binding cassette subfamily B protein
VLRGLSLEVPAGTHVGIVGATGGGKSTVLNLLMRFRDPVSGRVTVDGVDLRDLRVADVRDRFGLVLQDVHLFPGTVLENLGGEEAAARRALEVVGVDLALDHVLSEGGGNLSRGERQLVTFARALVRDPEILVLDEATSAIDPATESAVQAALRRVQSGRTTVTVAHRLKTVRDCDRIYVLAAGEVREAGTHDELLARDGLYAALYKLQEAA